MAARVAAAAAAVCPLLMGRQRTGTVLGIFARALIAGVAGNEGSRVISVLAAGAAGVPNGVRISGGPVSFGAIRRGDPVVAGDGSLRVGDLQLRIVRSWSSRVLRIRPSPEGVSALAVAAQRAGRGVPLSAVTALERAVSSATAGNRADLSAAVTGLVGLGQGLTPGGDDVLAGLLNALHAGGARQLAERIGAVALPGIADRTTLLSADLLRLAADGHACQEALAVLGELHRGGWSALHDVPPEPLAASLLDAIGRLLSIGHTSGADLATGLAMGLRCALPEWAGGGPTRQEAI